jgi:dihydrofolate reductase
MRKIICSAHVSLDGFSEGPDGGLDWLLPQDEAVEKDLGDLLASADLVLLGLDNYEEFVKVWPTKTGGIADLINRLPKIVLFRAEEELATVGGEWGTIAMITGDAETELQKLKQESGGTMVIFGCGELVRDLNAALIDEYRVLVHPVTRGAGKSVLADLTHSTPLQLAASRGYPNGSVLLTYQLLEVSDGGMPLRERGKLSEASLASRIQPAERSGTSRFVRFGTPRQTPEPDGLPGRAAPDLHSPKKGMRSAEKFTNRHRCAGHSGSSGADGLLQQQVRRRRRAQPGQCQQGRRGGPDVQDRL